MSKSDLLFIILYIYICCISAEMVKQNVHYQ